MSDAIRKELIDLLNGLCWNARRYGHDDNGLDCGVDYDGVESDPEDDDTPHKHREAVTCADAILNRWVVSDHE